MKKLLPIIIGVLIVVGGILLLNQDNPNDIGKGTTKNEEMIKAIVYKSPSCGCCVGYSKALEEHNFEVEIISTEDMQSIKDQYNIPRNMESCHTTIVGDYFIEGHVPLEAVDKLLLEQPDIDGIALPNMPAGTPGMPGIKSAPYTIFQLMDGVSSEFTNI